MRCAPGTHEAAFALMMRYLDSRTGALDPSAGVLDLGAGSGAFVARLQDAGFHDLQAVERDPPRFEVEGVDPIPLDLDGRFAKRLGRRYSIVIATEVIEHLESPARFLRQVHQLLEEDGILLISTPNVSGWIGRLKFLLQGELLFFDPETRDSIGHISPLPRSLLRGHLEATGFEIVDATSAGDFAGPLQKLVTTPARWLFRAVYGPVVIGDSYIVLARKCSR